MKTFNGNNTVSLPRHEQVCLISLRCEKYFCRHPDDGRSISPNITSLNILVHKVLNLLYYEHWTDKWNIFRHTSMGSLEVNSGEMWGKCSIPRVMPSFRERYILQKQCIIFTPYWEKNFRREKIWSICVRIIWVG